MHPFLFEFHWGSELYRIPSYGVMLALAFSLGYFDALRRAVKTGESPDHIENLFLVVVGASVVGARMFHVLFEEPSFYRQNPAKIFALWEGGYTFYGAVLLGLVGIYLYCRWKKINFLPYGDIIAPATALGLFIGRFGCFLAGCCWGRPSDLPWAVIFKHPETFASVKGISVHPTQIYESVCGLAIYAYLTWRFKRRHYTGQILFHGVAVYAILRIFVEHFRGDGSRGFILGGIVSYSQLVSVSLLPLALFGMRHFSKQLDNRTAD